MSSAQPTPRDARRRRRRNVPSSALQELIEAECELEEQKDSSLSMTDYVSILFTSTVSMTTWVIKAPIRLARYTVQKITDAAVAGVVTVRHVTVTQ